MTKSSTDIDFFLESLTEQGRQRLTAAVKTFTEWLLTRQKAKCPYQAENSGNSAISEQPIRAPGLTEAE
jgi:hypothetical protein